MFDFTLYVLYWQRLGQFVEGEHHPPEPHLADAVDVTSPTIAPNNLLNKPAILSPFFFIHSANTNFKLRDKSDNFVATKINISTNVYNKSGVYVIDYFFCAIYIK